MFISSDETNMFISSPASCKGLGRGCCQPYCWEPESSRSEAWKAPLPWHSLCPTGEEHRGVWHRLPMCSLSLSSYVKYTDRSPVNRANPAPLPMSLVRSKGERKKQGNVERFGFVLPNQLSERDSWRYLNGMRGKRGTRQM